MNTWSGFLCVILVAGSLVGPASAQSMFHFPQVGSGGPGTLTVANVDARAAEVDFELFGLDGGAPGNALERVRYRLASGEVFSMPVDTVFAAAGARGWIRVSSDLSGLTAELVSGDAVSNLEVIPSARPLSDQIVVMPPSNAPVARQLRIVNPSAQRVSVSVMVFDGQGTAVGLFRRPLKPKRSSTPTWRRWPPFHRCWPRASVRAVRFWHRLRSARVHP